MAAGGINTHVSKTARRGAPALNSQAKLSVQGAFRVILGRRGLVMTQIQGISGMTPNEIAFELNRGGRFVVYRYCFSAVFITVMQGTDVYFIRANQNAIVKGLPWTLLTLLAGWWGIPWGPIRTVQSLWINLHGGTDVTAGVADSLQLTGVNWDVVGAH